MKNIKIHKTSVYIMSLVILLAVSSGSLLWLHAIDLPLIIIALIVSSLSICLLMIAAVQALGNRNPIAENYESGPIAKTLSLLIIAAVLTSIIAAVKSLWLDPSYAKFAYENSATLAGFAAILLTFILSALQKDIYWITRKKALTLDERQIKERQQVFETSYKLGAIIVLGMAWLSAQTLHNIPVIMANHFNTMPGHLLWLPMHVVLILVALPLVVAAWKK